MPKFKKNNYPNFMPLNPSLSLPAIKVEDNRKKPYINNQKFLELKKKENEPIDEEKNEDKDSDVSIGSIGPPDNKDSNNKEKNDESNKNKDQNENSGMNNMNDDEGSDLSLTDL